jgi:DNA-binding LacI/PurR family transcriptional regulator
MNQKARQLRIAVLLFDPADAGCAYFVDWNHRLSVAGHVSFFARKTLCELDMDVARLAKMVRDEQADGWAVVAAPAQILEWFVQERIPAFALFGRRQGVDLAGAGPDKLVALRQMVDRLVELGHRRIVMVTHKLRRLPELGLFEREFIHALQARGLQTGPYNLPDWDNNAKDLHRCLEGLFRFSPPTAIIADEVPQYFAVMQFCLSRGLRVPKDVSMVCNDSDSSFGLFDSMPARIVWDPDPVIRHLLRWADALSKGRDMRRQVVTPSKFMDGGSVGPVAQGKVVG